MNKFEDFNISSQLKYAIEDLSFSDPTPIQSESFPVIMSGKDMVGIAQTGTGKTFAYMLPILQSLTYSTQKDPRVLILVPTRELVVQVVDRIVEFTKYIDSRVIGVYGGVNLNTHKNMVAEGCDILVATPGRLYDLILGQSLKMKHIKKLVVDEVDIMLDLGFKFQLVNIFELLPPRRQNILFSATMTESVEALIDGYFLNPIKIAVAVSGTPLDNIEQECYEIKNFFTKVNLVKHFLEDEEKFSKVLIFVAYKRIADRLFRLFEEQFGYSIGVLHANKTQNYRLKAIENFAKGKHRVLITTDVMARGIDIDKVTNVINFDVPKFAENYMHRIGRTGRAKEAGHSVLLYTEDENKEKDAIEKLMNYTIPLLDMPEGVEISKELSPEERPENEELKQRHKKKEIYIAGASFHEKSEKNSKVNTGGSYKRELAKKYKKPQRRYEKITKKKNKK